MRTDGRRSRNVEDRRRGGGAARVAVGGSVGCGSLLLIGVFLLLGGDPGVVLQVLAEDAARPTAAPRSPSQDDALADFAAVVLADTEDTWNPLFSERGGRYAEPTLVLFEDRVRSACGTTDSAVGPFYCPGDHKLYLDLGFFTELDARLGAPGDFAAAYVIAHEVGHHVQNLLGTMATVQRAQARMSEVDANALSVSLELQADCYAGVWAHHAHRQRGIVERGDIEEAMNAAHAIGDDTLQRRSRGVVRPDAFTHGTSAQRMAWFRRGLEAGQPEACALQ